MIRVYYKKFSYEKSYQFIMSGKIVASKDSGSESGDFTARYFIHTLGKSDFYSKKIDRDFYEYIVEDAISEVFTGDSILNINQIDKKIIVNEKFYVKTVS